MVSQAIGPIGVVLADLLVMGLTMRRQLALRFRPVGRRLPAVPEAAARFEAALARQSSYRTAEDATPPSGTVQLGQTAEGAVLSCDLPRAGRVSIVAPEADARDITAAIAGQLVTDARLTRPDVVLVGPSFDWLSDLSRGEAELLPDFDLGKRALSSDLAARQDYLHLSGSDAPRRESDGASDPGTTAKRRAQAEADLPPTIFCFDEPVESPAGDTLAACGISVVAPATAAGITEHAVTVGADGQAHTSPESPGFVPQALTCEVRVHLEHLIGATSGVRTEPAEWWCAGPKDVPGCEDALPSLAMLPPTLAPARLVEHDLTKPAPPDPTHPRLLVLGPVKLANTLGPVPDRGVRACAESLAWLLRNPGGTPVQMAHDLLITEGTRRSTISRLRAWLGRLPDGTMYLPEAYSGHLTLDTSVDSDWDEFMLLIAPGVNRASEYALRGALELVRGVPLADAPLGQWGWAIQWRLDMTSAVRDAAAVLVARSLGRGDLDLARWACGRGLDIVPDDDLMLRLRLRTEHQAGNRTEVRRLITLIVTRARDTAVDLSDEMITVLQEVSPDAVKE